jgi:hypothetical protein
MPSFFTKQLKIKATTKAKSADAVEQVKTVSEFLADAAEMSEKSDVFESITKAIPWKEVGSLASATSGAAAEALPPIKFAVKLVELLTKENEPTVLGYLAATLAYQQSVRQALLATGEPAKKQRVTKELAAQLRRSEFDNVDSFSTFAFFSAPQHPFIKHSNEVTQDFLLASGFSRTQTNQILNGINSRFVGHLKSLLSNGKVREKFLPFTQMMVLGTNEAQTYDALFQHSEYQRWLFEEAPVFSKEPFALAHVYVDTECGDLTWREIQNGTDEEGNAKKALDPFSEENGGRVLVLQRVKELLGDPKFKDAIIVQGVAGAGKSTFTLRLCSDLLKEGLRPIRVRLRDLRMDLSHVSESLPRAISLGDGVRTQDNRVTQRDLFLGGSIFDSHVVFGQATISPYVLILDGWDEISISAKEGFRDRVTRMLEQLRAEYLRNRSVLIRVILTGRPSADVTGSGFMRDETRVLTLRALRPAHLELFIRRMSSAIKQRPVLVDNNDPWTIPSLAHFQPILERYSADFSRGSKSHSLHSVTDPFGGHSGSVEVLGLPLLAHLAIRLLSQWSGDVQEVIKNPTTLYRSLVDLTCEKAGKSPEDAATTEDQPRIVGEQLRDLLRRTAAAMTAYGEESIPFEELALRLNFQGDELNRQAAEATEKHVLTSLMISFYFRGGHPDLGCEFLHKSFREYLFAEAVIEALKRFGRQQVGTGAERVPFWTDFDPASSDSLYQFSRELGELLAPQWLSPEVVRHLHQLIAWEIQRAKTPEIGQRIGTPTPPIGLARWAIVRDGLADIWDWWGEGVHLRSQPTVSGVRKTITFEPPYAQELAESALPRANLRFNAVEPRRLTTMDSHLGDGLFRLSVLVHFHCALQSGWIPSSSSVLPRQLWNGVSHPGDKVRRCQVKVLRSKTQFVLFSPAGKSPRFWTNYIARINAAGWRPYGPFPLGVDLRGVDLRGVEFSIQLPLSPPVASIDWSYANLSAARITGSLLYDQKMQFIQAENVSFWKSLLSGTDFKGANLTAADLQETTLLHTNFEAADLQKVNFQGALVDRSTQWPQPSFDPQTTLQEIGVTGRRYLQSIPESLGSPSEEREEQAEQ